ncbi:carboxypeptidase-like regulatory domain-containing protein [Kangiella sediminilitoris]|uniref:Putative lipoprotein n=1 Tax=Kangiella sediminilitoris TaxID=1144748 RepID=A0A1B3B8A2_9GAMM|nr:carboxypeptidase-like regulatory domain-containing protein [Kangiella sediminilitoris]AOE49032.1 Putative lipoprotein [Kangiella sediminilitoris]
MKQLKVVLITAFSILLYACGGGSDSNDNSTPPPSGGSGQAATISGTATYDNVPHNTSTSGLNYNATTQDPIRGATVQLLEGSSGSTVIDTTVSDANGRYSLQGETGATYRIRIRAELKKTGTPAWDVEVVDNTNSGALYVLDSESFSPSSTSTTRNLNAASGWGGSSYISTRAAAPFHILDRAYEIIAKLQTVDADIQLPSLVINWSPNNIPEPGDTSTGKINTSFYSNGKIFLLGAEDTDTDEYDGHVIIHEWGHYFEDTNARSDSIGGRHAGGDRLDMRVAFGEGFGNAWSGIITDDPLYRDSFGPNQASGFVINVENNNVSNPGWFSEGSVQSILYDIYDSNNEDPSSLGLQPIYDVLTGSQRDTQAFTSIFSFMTYMKANNPGDTASLDLLLIDQNIQTNVDIWGSNETDSEGQPEVLPVYETFSAGDSRQLCTISTFGGFSSNENRNKLGNRKFLRLNIQTNGSYTLRLTPSGSRDLDGYIYSRGTIVAADDSFTSSTVNITQNFSAGTYVADVLVWDQADCFDVSLIQN